MIIINAQIVTWDKPNKILLNHALRIAGTYITDISKEKELVSRYPMEEVLDAKGQFLMPGLICAHTHFYSAFSRGLSIPGNNPANFPEILKKLWWPLDQSLDKDDIKYSALVCMIDAIKHGTTTLFDHHASPNYIIGSLDVIEEAFNQTGLRGVICYEVTDRNGIEKTNEGIDENLRMINKLAEYPGNGRVNATFGMHAGLTLSEDTLKRCRERIPVDCGIHIHVAEHPVDEYDSLKKTGERVIDRLNRHDFLGENSIIVHGVHLDMKEVNQLLKTKTWLSHQPRSNMNNAVGLSDMDSLLRLGLKVCLGNDGFSNAMWDEWRTCYLVHKNWNHDPQKMNANNVIEMAIHNNSELTSHFFNGNKIGKIEIGAKADLILVDYTPFTELSAENLPWHIIFGFRDSMVTTTIVDGNVLMKDRKFAFLDETEILKEAFRFSKEVWKRYARKVSRQE